MYLSHLLCIFCLDQDTSEPQVDSHLVQLTQCRKFITGWRVLRTSVLWQPVLASGILMGDHDTVGYSRSGDCTLNDMKWCLLVTLKHLNTNNSDRTSPGHRSIFYMKQYCEICFLWCVHTLCLVLNILKWTVITKRGVLTHSDSLLKSLTYIPSTLHKRNEILYKSDSRLLFMSLMDINVYKIAMLSF